MIYDRHKALKKKVSISLYWKCQLIGWSAASLYWSYLGLSGGHFNLFIGLLQFLSDVVLYILITHAYRNFALSNGWTQLNMKQLLKRIVPAILVMGLAYLLLTVIKSYLFRLWLQPGNTQAFLVFFEQNWVTMLMAGIRLMAIWLLAYHLYHYAQREISIARDNARLFIIAKDAQLNNLSTQLNPHFLFNSLNNIKALVIEDPKSARRSIDLLSDILRKALYNGDLLTTSVANELGLVKDYLELEQLRFEERLQFNITADAHLNHTRILRFSVQTLVENAVKHGIAKEKNGGIIIIEILSENGFIKIIVQNPGVYHLDPSSQGLGIKNLTERLQIQYNGKAEFSIGNQSAGIVLSTIIIPVV